MSLNLRYFDDLVLGQNEQLPDVHHLTEAEIMTFAKAWDPQPFHIDAGFASRAIQSQPQRVSSLFLFYFDDIVLV